MAPITVHPEIVLLTLTIASVLLAGFCGHISAVFAASGRRMTDAGKEHLVLSLAGATSCMVFATFALMTVTSFPSAATGWYVLSILYAATMTGAIAVRWFHSYRQGRRAPLLLTFIALICLGLLLLNIFRLSMAWPFLAALGVYLGFVGFGNYVMLLYEIQLGAGK